MRILLSFLYILPCFDDVAESCTVQIIILCKISPLHIANSP